MSRSDIRFALPSKGRLEPESLAFLSACGLGIYKPNPRQYQATIPVVPDLSVLFQRPGDIVVGRAAGQPRFWHHRPGHGGRETHQRRDRDAA